MENLEDGNNDHIITDNEPNYEIIINYKVDVEDKIIVDEVAEEGVILLLITLWIKKRTILSMTRMKKGKNNNTLTYR